MIDHSHPSHGFMGPKQIQLFLIQYVVQSGRDGGGEEVAWFLERECSRCKGFGELEETE